MRQYLMVIIISAVVEPRIRVLDLPDHVKPTFHAKTLTRFNFPWESRIQSKLYQAPKASIEDYPFMVHLAFYKQGQFSTCGGSCIHVKYILTARHCNPFDKPRQIMACMGSSHTALPKLCDTYRLGSRMVLDDSKDNDIMVIILKEPFETGKGIAVLPLRNYNISAHYDGYCYAPGWGAFNLAMEPSEDLRVTNFTIVKEETTERFVTVFSSEHNACKGDSGGPLVCDCILVGVASTSTTAFCDSGTGTSVYVNVAPNLLFMDRVLSGEFDGAGRRTPSWLAYLGVVLLSAL